MDQKRSLLRHFPAALADRMQKNLRGARLEFASFRAAPKVRTPHDLIRHMDWGIHGPPLSVRQIEHAEIIYLLARFEYTCMWPRTLRASFSISSVLLIAPAGTTNVPAFWRSSLSWFASETSASASFKAFLCSDCTITSVRDLPFGRRSSGLSCCKSGMGTRRCWSSGSSRCVRS
jgi:hypothetical protein